MNTGLVRYSNGRKLSGCQMASEYRTKKSGIRMVIMQPKKYYVVRSLPFEYRTIWILVLVFRSIRYSDSYCIFRSFTYFRSFRRISLSFVCYSNCSISFLSLLLIVYYFRTIVTASVAVRYFYCCTSNLCIFVVNFYVCFIVLSYQNIVMFF